ncbi:MAG: MOFRL family protein [Yoonia sp.]|nr:MOFRL family protein [Yoonia sp.]
MRRPYRKLNIDERRILATMLQAKATKTKIAETLGRDRSTIHREIKRNWWHDDEVPQADGYWHVTAQTLADRRYMKRRKLEQHKDLRQEVIAKLKTGWSPEQIAGRLKIEPRAPYRICHETIYQYIYSESGQSQELGRYLPERQKKRKHLSLVKGGQLAAACYPAKLLTLLISDVPGDDPSQIASGPTVGEESTALDALDILDRRGIALAPHIRTAIAKASSVVLPNDPRLKCAQTRIVAAPSHSIAAAAKLAVAAGLDVRDLGDALEGEARDLGAQQAQLALSLQSKLTPSDRPILLLSGGECTVTRCGDGIGGPNAEYTLSAAITLNGQQGIHVLACDTDGVDGAAEVAGAYAGPDTLSIAQRAGSDAAAALIRNDAHGFFAAVKGQIITGPTLTNVNDFRAVLILPLNELAIISQVV